MSDWIEWHGGECPVGRAVVIDAKMRHGGIARGEGEAWRWSKLSKDSDIIAYRVVAEPSELPVGNRDAESALAVQIGGDHYKGLAIQPVVFNVRNKLGFLESCVVKRAARHDKPTGKGRQDIEKAIHELQLILELQYGEVA